MPAGIIPFLPAIASGFGSIFGAATAKSQQNKANRFNLEMWNRQNIYNSPVDQMRRLRMAGLNPNLIYGSSGNTGNAGSAPQFTSMSESGYKPIDTSAITSALQSFTDWDIKKAQEDKLQTSIQLDKARILDINAATVSKNLSNITGKEKARIAKEMADISLDAAKSNVKKTMADIEYTTSSNVRAEAKNLREEKYLSLSGEKNEREWQQLGINARQANQNIAESMERINKMYFDNRLTQEQTNKVIQTIDIDKVKEYLSDMGIHPDSPSFIKYLWSALDGSLLEWSRKLYGQEFRYNKKY